MQNTAESLKYFIPRKNIWLTRLILLLGFIMFDYTSTLTFCNTPFLEGNIYARAFMETFGIGLGLTLFNIITTTPLYLIFSVDSHAIRLPPKILKLTNPVIDGIFAWFIAGTRFNGATSWFWSASTVVRQMIGAALYLILIFITRKLVNS